LSDSTAMITQLNGRISETQRTLATSEQDRRVLQERFDNTRSDDNVLRFQYTADQRLC